MIQILLFTSFFNTEGETKMNAKSLVLDMCYRMDGLPVKNVTAHMLSSLITCILVAEAEAGNVINRSRDEKRLKTKMFELIERNIELFKAYHDCGTRILILE